MHGRVMFYVQHLLGIGHLKRASLIARAMVEAGLDVAVVLGGPDVPGIEFEGCARIFLPPARTADETFTVLLDDEGRPVDDAWRDQRASRLLQEFDALRPNVLMLELFPFGRRMFGFELLPLLTKARCLPRPPRLVCSLRDILVAKPEAERNRRRIAFAKNWFDRVLVHGDPRLIPIEASYPGMGELGEKLVYTGYVVDDAVPASEPESESVYPLGHRPIGEGEVIVSVGGGAVGLPLLQAAREARASSPLADRPWRLITGPNLPDDAFTALAWSQPPGFIVERWRSDLPTLLHRCAVSISQAGYNTVMDILQARARAVLVPFSGGTETEQSLRARVLDERGLAVSVDPATLSPKILSNALARALTLTPHSVEINCNGAATTAQLVGDLCRSVVGTKGMA